MTIIKHNDSSNMPKPSGDETLIILTHCPKPINTLIPILKSILALAYGHKNVTTGIAYEQNHTRIMLDIPNLPKTFNQDTWLAAGFPNILPPDLEVKQINNLVALRYTTQNPDVAIPKAAL